MAINKNFIIVGVLILLGLFFFSSIQSMIGISPIAIQKVDYVSNDPFFGSATWMINLIADGSGGKVHVKPSSLLLTDGTTPDKPFDLEIEVIEQSCKWKMEEERKEIFWFDFRNFKDDPYGVCQSPLPHEREALTDGTGRGKCWVGQLDNKGYIHRLDPAPIPDWKLKIAFTVDDEKSELFLSPTEQEGQVSEFLRAKFLGWFGGTQLCPTSAPSVVIFEDRNGEFSVKDKFEYDMVRTFLQKYKHGEVVECFKFGQCTNYGDYLKNHIKEGAHSTSEFNELYNNFLSADTGLSEQCEFLEVNKTTASVKCGVEDVFRPMVQLFIKADKIGFTVPSGDFQIQEIETKEFYKPQETDSVRVKVLNRGESDSFDTALSCSDFSWKSERDYLPSDSTQTIDLQVSGSGAVRNCEIKVNSINNPEKQEVQEVKLIFAPSCEFDESQLETGKSIIYSEYGCFQECDNRYTDMVTGECLPISLAEVVEAEGGVCLGNREALSLDEALEKLEKGEISLFIPQEIEHSEWLGFPNCQYVGKMGYNVLESDLGITVREIKDDFDYLKRDIPLASGVSIEQNPIFAEFDLLEKESTIKDVPQNPILDIPVIGDILKIILDLFGWFLR